MNLLLRLPANLVYFPTATPDAVEAITQAFLLNPDGSPTTPNVLESRITSLGILEIRSMIELDKGVAPLFEALKAEMNRQKHQEIRDLAFNMGALRTMPVGREQ